ncbi:MAG TPA: transporter substrate-binding domain-containing protein [bacterium]|nr:transporter substrate-binding domain-containing protein [bacterium]
MRDHCPRVALAGMAVFLIAACSSGGAGRPPLPPAPHPSAQGPVVAAIKRAGVLRVASDLTYPPLAFRDQGAPQGFEMDLAGLLAAALGVRLEVIDTPRAAARAGDVDADLLISEWEAEGAPGPASTPYYVMRQAILWREKQTPAPDGSLRNVRVAVQARSRGQAVAERLGATLAVVEYQPLEALGAVARGTVQAAVVDLPLVAAYARTHPRLRMSTGSWVDMPLVVVVRPRAPDLLAFTSAVIQELDQRGGLAQLRRRWQL